MITAPIVISLLSIVISGYSITVSRRSIRRSQAVIRRTAGLAATPMPALQASGTLPEEELEGFRQRWLAANKKAERQQ